MPAGRGLCCDALEGLQGICFSDLFLEKVVECCTYSCVLTVCGVFVCLFVFNNFIEMKHYLMTALQKYFIVKVF